MKVLAPVCHQIDRSLDDNISYVAEGRLRDRAGVAYCPLSSPAGAGQFLQSAGSDHRQDNRPVRKAGAPLCAGIGWYGREHFTAGLYRSGLIWRDADPAVGPKPNGSDNQSIALGACRHPGPDPHGDSIFHDHRRGDEFRSDGST